MFGHESKPCKVYEYGCLPPTEGEEAFLEEIRRRHNLWNRLVEIEHDHRAKVREVLVVPDDPMPAMYDRLKELRQQIKEERKQKRSGKVDVSELQQQVKELQAAIKEEKMGHAATKKEIAATNKPLLQELDEERKALVKEAAKASGLYWCNYEEVVMGYDTARKKAMRDKTELKFHRWEGVGKVTVRFQKGLPVPALFTSDKRLQVDPVESDAWEHPTRSVRRKASRTAIRLRVTSDEAKKPVWIELPMVMHRPLPPESEIRSASIVRERVGRKYRYKAIITATTPDVLKAHGRGVMAIDLGWRKVKDGLRVAFWADDNDNSGSLVLPHGVLYEFNKLDDLKSIRDTHHNEAKTELVEWLAGNAMPEWMAEDTATLSQWRSPARMVSLVRKWSDNRFEGDADIFNVMWAWRGRELHLYDWETNLRDQVIKRRQHIYRNFAARAIERCDTIVVEDMDLRGLARKASPESGTSGSLPTDRQRVMASVSELRLALENACRQAGVDYIKEKSAFSTLECCECGFTERYDAAVQIWHTCPKCHALWDQDENAARNLLKRHSLKTTGN